MKKYLIIFNNKKGPYSQKEIEGKRLLKKILKHTNSNPFCKIKSRLEDNSLKSDANFYIYVKAA